MISTQCHDFLASVRHKYCPTISNVCCVAYITDDEYHDSARPRPFYDLPLACRFIFLLTHLQKACLCFREAFVNGSLRVARETVLFDHVMVKIVSEELRTGRPSMSIIHSKERALGPGLMLSVFWLDNVQYD